MSYLEENARLSHELEEARDVIEGQVNQVTEMRKALTKALEENRDLRKELENLRERGAA